jgi:3D (Asp-Asp-Asp) domain-containing protein
MMKKTLLFTSLICALLLTGCAYISRPLIRGRREVTVAMEVTAYCPCGECCGWHKNWYGLPIYNDGPLKGKPKRVGITADGTRVRKGTIAADTSIYPYGTHMYVPGYGWGVVHDVGSDIKGNHIDVFFPRHQQAVNWGRRRLNVKVIWR